MGCFDGEGGEIGYVVGFVEQFGVAGLEEDFGVALEGDGFDVFAGDVAVGVDFVDEGGTDEGFDRHLVDGCAAVDEVEGGVEVGASVDAHVDGGGVGGIAAAGAATLG